MRLCDFLLFDPDDDGTDGRPLNRCPAGPWREGTDPPKCWRCGGWVPHGPLLDPTRLKVLAGEASSLLASSSSTEKKTTHEAASPSRPALPACLAACAAWLMVSLVQPTIGFNFSRSSCTRKSID